MVEKLPEGYSKIFKLAVLEGLSHKEIGKLLNIAPPLLLFSIIQGKKSYLKR